MDLRRIYLQAKSDEERWFIWWMAELVQEGYIEDIKYEKYIWKLTPPSYFWYKKVLKTKTKLERRILIREHQYTCDYSIVFADKARYYFFEELDAAKPVSNRTVPLYSDDKNLVHIEVKPKFDQNNMEREFTINQKFLYSKFNTYINKVKPANFRRCFFDAYFCPDRFLRQDKQKGNRKLHFRPTSLSEYIARVKTQAATEGWSYKLRNTGQLGLRFKLAE